MDLQDNINIYIPYELKTKIQNDARLFEIYGKGRRTINSNGFISSLLLGYYDNYLSERSKCFNSIIDIIHDYDVPDTEKREIAEAILQNIMFPGIMTSDSKSKNSETIKLKPTKSTYRIILSIEGQLAGNDTISQFVRRMMISYFNKPMWEREQIIFHDQVEIIKESCAKKKPISFTIKYKEKELHEVMPYQLVEGKDGMFNYLVCVEMISGIPKVLSYRLNRITNLGLGRKFPPISREILALCKKTADESPQYALNAIEESCVKLNDSGEISYKRIFFGRPNYTRIEDRSDGHYYYFDCSETQLFHYFRRFENSTAVIISPLSLREKLAKFHSQAYENYK